MSRVRPILTVALAMLCATASVAAQGTPAVTTPPPVTPYPSSPRPVGITVSSTNAPLRVPGSDGMDHWEYDLIVTNVLPAPLTLTAVEVFSSSGERVALLDGDPLVAATQPIVGTEPMSAIPGSGTVAVVVDVAVPAGTPILSLSNRLTYTYPADAHGAAIVGTTTCDGPVLEVNPRLPVSIAPPMAGDGWIAFNGCCADPGSVHRTIRVPMDGGGIAKAELFAIDWLQLDDGAFSSGDGSKNEDWFGYGADLFAVAAGTVVYVRDGMPEQAPNAAPAAPVVPEDYAGNQIILEIAPGVYALYGHLQTGSVAVKVGDRVAAGQTIARLGNSGNSNGPHLHFSILDKPNALTGNSLPFVLTAYTLEGVADPSVLVTDPDARLPIAGPSSPQVETFPLWMTVIDLDD